MKTDRHNGGRLVTRLITRMVLAVTFCSAAAAVCAAKDTHVVLPDVNNAHFRGRIAECARYESLHPRFAKAFAFMRRPDLADLPCGRYEIDGSNCWAMVQEVSLKPFVDENKYEVHRAFIDIQAPITGSETIGVTEPEPKVFDGFNVEKDYVLFMAKGEPWTLKPGEFAIFLPEKGAHAPGLSSDGSRSIRKLVIKVRNSL